MMTSAREERAPAQRRRLRIRHLFYAAALVLFVLSITLSWSTHVTGTGYTPTIHNAGRPALTPCPTVGFDPRCYPVAPFDGGGLAYPVYGHYFQLPWILVGLAAALIVAGVGLALDRD